MSEDLSKRVASLPWFHSIRLPNGIVTPGGGRLPYLEGAANIYFGMGIHGMSVLDVGAYDGFFSFDAERRGAADVLAVDYVVWEVEGRRAAFDLCCEALGSRVRDEVLDVWQTTKETVGEFDVVLFNGIFYHIIDPIHALIEMSRIAREVLTVETWIDNVEVPRAVMNFFPAEETPPGYPKWGWGPNSLLMHALLKRLGFETVLEWPTPTHETKRSIFIGFKPGHRFGDYVREHIDRARPRLGATPATPHLLADIHRLNNEKDAIRRELESVHLDLEGARRDCDALRRSTSWRITGPLRMLRRALPYR